MDKESSLDYYLPWNWKVGGTVLLQPEHCYDWLEHLQL
jgi:hypothetical protein